MPLESLWKFGSCSTIRYVSTGLLVASYLVAPYAASAPDGFTSVPDMSKYRTCRRKLVGGSGGVLLQYRTGRSELVGVSGVVLLQYRTGRSELVGGSGVRTVMSMKRWKHQKASTW
eukprot:1137193-Rhodomonas_salina.2